MRIASQRGAERGFVLLAVLGLLGLLCTLAFGGVLAVGPEPIVAGAFVDRLRIERAADMALRLAMQELAALADWTSASATALSRHVDGAPGPRLVPGGAPLDLVAETAMRTCGAATCDAAAVARTTLERPYGDANPHWRLVLHVPMGDVDATAAALCPCYLAAWVADDPADTDGDPWADAPTGVDGHGVLLVRGAAFGPGAAWAEVEALVARPCAGVGALEACEPGIRVQSWRAIRASLP